MRTGARMKVRRLAFGLVLSDREKEFRPEADGLPGNRLLAAGALSSESVENM
jgi:hypothetical protein